MRTALICTSGAIVVAGATVGGIYASGGFQSHGQPASSPAHVAAARHIPARPVPPLRLLSVSPANGTQDVDGADGITVALSKPLPAGAALPQLSPDIAGTWQQAGDSLVFTPQVGFTAGTRVTVTVPAADGTVRSGYKSTFTTAPYSVLRLQELLAQLGYLPMTWTPDGGEAIQASSPSAQLEAAYDAPAGTFRFQGGYPKELYSFWQEGSDNLLLKGAITGFEGDHGMTTDGVASAQVWAAVIKAAETGQRNTDGYSYAIANQDLPETLTIWHNGREVFSSPTNTGVSVAPTPVGTFPVYLKLPYQVMSGYNPDGSYYADPVQWVSYFSGGSAVHYIARGSYGWPQSLGCVELPYTAAEQAYPILPYGTLVTVTP